MSEYKHGEKVHIEVNSLHFYVGGNTIWVECEDGNALRIKCTGKITTEICKSSPSSHCDLAVEGDIHYCISAPEKKKNAIKKSPSKKGGTIITATTRKAKSNK